MRLPPAPQGLQDLLDRAAITDLRHAYAHGIDRRDWALYRGIFADRVDVDFSTWAGIRESFAADDWVALVKQTLAPFDATQHSFSNLFITLDGNRATCMTNMTAKHVLDGQSQILGGYYVDRLARTAQGWKITACQLVVTWEEGDRALFDRAAARGPRPRIDDDLAPPAG